MVDCFWLYQQEALCTLNMSITVSKVALNVYFFCPQRKLLYIYVILRFNFKLHVFFFVLLNFTAGFTGKWAKPKLKNCWPGKEWMEPSSSERARALQGIFPSLSSQLSFQLLHREDNFLLAIKHTLVFADISLFSFPKPLHMTFFIEKTWICIHCKSLGEWICMLKSY